MNEVTKYENILRKPEFGISTCVFFIPNKPGASQKKTLCPFSFNKMSCSNDMVHHHRYKLRESPFLQGVAGPVRQSEKPILWLAPRSLLWATADVTFCSVGFGTVLIDVGASGAKAPGRLRSSQNLRVLDAKHEIEIEMQIRTAAQILPSTSIIQKLMRMTNELHDQNKN